MLIVTMPAEDRSLTTLEAVKAELELTGTDHDSYLGNLIGQASRAIESWCGRCLVREGVREVVHLTEPAGVLLLSRFPVAAITSVTSEAGSLAPTLYEIDPDTGMLYRLTSYGARSVWLTGRIFVDYAAGFIPPGAEGRTLPADIERAAILAVRSAWHTRGRDQTVRSEDVEGVGSFTYGLPATLPTDVTDLLAPYRLPGFA